MRLTVYFEDPFWVGVFEQCEANKASFCKITFGAEPTDAQIYAFILQRYNRLVFSKPVKAVQKITPDNPKRRQRAAKKALETPPRSTKAQQALQKQYEENKAERKRLYRANKEIEKQRRFDMKQQKKKQKKKGH